MYHTFREIDPSGLNHTDDALSLLKLYLGFFHFTFKLKNLYLMIFSEVII